MKWLLLISVFGSVCLGYFLGLQHSQGTLPWSSTQASVSRSQATLADNLLKDRGEEAESANAFDTLFEASFNTPFNTSFNTSHNTQAARLSFSQLFITLLESHQYADAINLYRTIKQTSEKNSPELKEIFLSHIEQLMLRFSNNQAYIRQALEMYLYEFYNDIDTLMLLSKYHVYSEHYFEGVNTLQLIGSYAYSETDKRKINYFHPQLIQLIEDSLSNSQRWRELIHVYQHIENAGLLTLENQYRLTELLLTTEENEQALAYAEYLLESNDWKNKTTALLKSFLPDLNKEANLDPKKIAAANIPLEKYNNQFIISVTLSLKTETPLLIDTGASITTLSKDYYDSISNQLNKQYKGEAKFSTANGQTNGKIYTIDQLTIGQHVLEKIDIAIIDFPSGEKSNGLLGMNILSQFHFTIDQENNFLTLEPR